MQAGGTGNAGKTDRVTAYPDACRINNRPAPENLKRFASSIAVATLSS
jgi:hypothetical protein